MALFVSDILWGRGKKDKEKDVHKCVVLSRQSGWGPPELALGQLKLCWIKPLPAKRDWNLLRTTISSSWLIFVLSQLCPWDKGVWIWHTFSLIPLHLSTTVLAFLLINLSQQSSFLRSADTGQLGWHEGISASRRGLGLFCTPLWVKITLFCSKILEWNPGSHFAYWG